MFLINNKNCYFFDVDNTLIDWRLEDYLDSMSYRFVKIKDPITKEIVEVVPIEKHIKLLKKVAGHGLMVIVWSNAGAEWAGAVVAKLKLQKYVKFCMWKPIQIVDDADWKDWKVINWFIHGEWGSPYK